MRRLLLGGGLTLLALASACREPTLVPPRSLEGPTAVVVSRGDVCLATFEDTTGVVTYSIEVCAPDVTGAIGLVVNERSDRLALVDLSLPRPRLVDLDAATPGPNHLKVGRLPVDVAVSPDGTAAYTLNQLDRDVSIVDLRGPEVLTERYHLDDTPVALDVEPLTGDVVVAAGSPSTLSIFGGATDCADERTDGEYRCEVAPAEDKARTLQLPGTVSDFVFLPQGDEAWIVYRDLEYASVLSFAPTPDGFDTPCLNGIDAKPCVTANVPLTYGCSDGIDNDGDGRVDQQDEQCWGPRGAESLGGIGRAAIDLCSNGLDDDGDGLTDRDDPECMAASGMAEDVATFDQLPLTQCNDGADDDGDGTTDYPADASCYGPLGRTEDDIRAIGYDAIGTDSHGIFVYVTDRAREQVLVVDRRRKSLIDVPKTRVPGTDAFDNGLGVNVIPSPLSVDGAIDRSIVWRDPDDSEHTIMRYDFGAWVASNDGSIQYVDALVTFCEITGETLVTRNEFWNRQQGEEESRCLDIPLFPLRSATFRVANGDPALPDACLTDDFVACAECVEAGSASCEPCDAFASTQFDLCSRAFVTDSVTALHNPRFALRDAGGEQARLLGAGSCEQPDDLLETITAYAQENTAAPQDLKCTSLLQPQPLQTAAAGVETTDTATLDELDRADIARVRTLAFDLDSEGLDPIVLLRPDDVLTIDEEVTVTYEGVLSGASRSDAVLAVDAEDDGSVWVDISIDACAADVREGDRFIITTERRENCDVEGALEYEVVEVQSGLLRIAPLDEGGLADEVPTRACFETAIDYDIRATVAWVVTGDVLGHNSPFESVSGQCVRRYGAEARESRLRTGELFVGPYYSFYLYPGFDPEAIEPVRDLSFTFQFASGFEPFLYPTCSSEGQSCVEGLFPTDVTWVPGLPNGSLLVAPDPNDNFIHIRNLDDSAQGYSVIR